MNTNNLNLCEFLKNHIGEAFYSPAYGTVILDRISNKDNDNFPIVMQTELSYCYFTSEGKLSHYNDADCVLFPSKNQRDWGKWAIEKKPKTWELYKECFPKFFDISMDSLEGFNEPIKKSALALLKIFHLIEEGYGGNITDWEWKDTNIKKYCITYNKHSERFHYIDSGSIEKQHIAFHTKEQCREFVSYPENIQLLKDFFMI